MTASPKIFHLLQMAHSALFRAANKYLRDNHRVSSAQLAILFAVADGTSRPISSLATQLNMGNSSITGLVDRMIGAGLITRRPDPTDLRVQLVTVSAEGQALVAAALPQIKAINKALVADFDEAEQRTIQKFLTNVATDASKFFAPEQ